MDQRCLYFLFSSFCLISCAGTPPSRGVEDIGGGAPSSSADARKEQGAPSIRSDAQSDVDVCPHAAGVLEPWIASSDLSKELLLKSKNGAKSIFIRNDGCHIRILGDCGVSGTYGFNSTGRTKIGEYIYNEGDLYKYLPHSASALAPQFKDGGLWSFQTVIVGEYKNSMASVGRDQLAEDCSEATHFVSKMSVGAYRIESKTEQRGQSKIDVVQRGGVFERCLLSETDASSPSCQAVVRLKLEPVTLKSALPPSAPHHLLDQFPGVERARRLEVKHTGQAIKIPAAGKVTVLAFWSAECEPCESEPDERERDDRKRARGKQGSSKEPVEECEPCEDPVYELSEKVLSDMESFWAQVNKTQVEIIGVGVDLDIFRARARLFDLPLTFPMVLDSESGKLKNRYHVGARLPVVFVIDQRGYVKYFGDGSPQSIDRARDAVRALAGN